MINKIYTVSEHLFYSDVVEIQTNISDKGLPTFEISGLISKTVEESKKRVFIALENSGFQFPLKNILVNIAPAGIPKSGTHYDMAIALSIIKDKLNYNFEKSVFLGELSFDGQLRDTDNIFYLIITAIERGFKNIFIPHSSVNKVVGLNNVNFFPLYSLKDLYNIDKIEPVIIKPSYKNDFEGSENIIYPKIFGNIRGKKAIAYSLIGKHHILIQGFPGVGKSMLAKSMAELSPNLSEEEFVNVNKIYSYSSISPQKINFRPPFRNPHPLSSYSSMFGSFNNKLLLGEVSLANKGILFLDEFPEFNRLIIEGLRIPLENKSIHLARSNFKAELECDFILVVASNPCKCGFFNHNKKNCSCSPIEVRRYQSRISGPVLDRIDIKLELNDLDRNEVDENKEYSNLEFSKLKSLIESKRELRKKLLDTTKITKNHDLDLYTKIVQNYLPIKLYNLIINELKSTSISERGKTKLINLIFTISLFNNRDQISIEDIFEGLSLTFKN